MDIEEAKEGLRKVHKFQRQVKKKDALLQIEHLTKLMMEKERHGDKCLAIYLRELKEVDQTRKKHCCIKFVKKKTQKDINCLCD